MGSEQVRQREIDWSMFVHQGSIDSTIIIDRPCAYLLFHLTDGEFLPKSLFIAQVTLSTSLSIPLDGVLKNETASWVLSNPADADHHRISIQSNENDVEVQLERLDDSLPGVHYLHRFDRSGEFSIRFDRFDRRGTVVGFNENESKDLLDPFSLIRHLTWREMSWSSLNARRDRNIDRAWKTDSSSIFQFSSHDLLHTRRISSNQTSSRCSSKTNPFRIFVLFHQRISSTILVKASLFSNQDFIFSMPMQPKIITFSVRSSPASQSREFFNSIDRCYSVQSDLRDGK